jgi:hypothetical protein
VRVAQTPSNYATWFNRACVKKLRAKELKHLKSLS